MSHQLEDSINLACADLVAYLLKEDSVTEDQLDNYRKSVCQRYSLRQMLGNQEIFSRLPNSVRERYSNLLQSKPIRTASGIAVIAVMAKPHPCPHGSCLYCPGGIQQGTPQSYTGYEPAAMRASENEYDPFRQVESRINQLKSAGHRIGKTELIIIGGTFFNLPIRYQRSFIKSCYDALNGRVSLSLREAKRLNETTDIRNVGLTVETRPDFCKQKYINLMMTYGVTRIELGVQALDDQIYQTIHRGHSVLDVVDAFRAAKDSGLKVVAHMMPGLPGSDPKKDLETFRRLFSDVSFKPDMLKIYPCLVVEHTRLQELYQKGLYLPYDEKTIVPLLADIKKDVPPWVRIMRIQREIPSHQIVSGIRSSNLREQVLEEVKHRGYSCQCIRCREIGIKRLKTGILIKADDIRLMRDEYRASDGIEIFLSYEDYTSNTLVGFLRLRIPSSKPSRREILEKRACLVREIHVYGPLVPVGLRDESSWQHQGFGTKLMKEAERISKEEFDAQRTVVISAIGVRPYFRRMGYYLKGPYMVKNLS